MIFLKLLFSCYRANFASRRIHIRLRVTRSKFYLAAAQFVDSKAFFLSPRCRSRLFAPKTTVGATLCGRPCMHSALCLRNALHFYPHIGIKSHVHAAAFYDLKPLSIMYRCGRPFCFRTPRAAYLSPPSSLTLSACGFLI